MGRVEIDHPMSFTASQMIWEGGPVASMTQGRVLDERHPDTHPLAKVVLKKAAMPTGLVTAPTFRPEDPVMLDSLDLKRMSAMEGGE